MIVPFAPGGPPDAIARLVSNRLGELLGQPIVVENRGGAGGNIGTVAVAKSAPDGYTVLMTSSAFAVNTNFPESGYSAERDFVPVNLVAAQPNVIYVHASVPVKTLAEFMAYAKDRKLAFATPGSGTTPHLTGENLLGVEGRRQRPAPAQEQRVEFAHRQLPPGRPAVVALVGALGLLHLPQQGVHLVQRQLAVGAHRAVAGHGGQQLVAGAFDHVLASCCASSASTLRASSTAIAVRQRGGHGAHASVLGRERRDLQAQRLQASACAASAVATSAAWRRRWRGSAAAGCGWSPARPSGLQALVDDALVGGMHVDHDQALAFSARM
jgi:hypothetical protein